MLRALLRAVFWLFWRPRVQCGEGVAPNSLIVANHVSVLDALLLGLYLPVSATVVVPVRIARRAWSKVLLGSVRHLVLDVSDPKSLRPLARRLAAGETVIVFPENRPTVTGGLMRLHACPAVLAARTGTPVVPVHIDGPQWTRFSPRTDGGRRRLSAKVRITVGAPESIPDTPGRPARERRRLATARLRDMMQRCAVTSTPPRNLYEAFCEAVRLHGGRNRIFEDIAETPLSYGQLKFRAVALGCLIQRVSRPQEVVGLLLPNVGAAVCLLLGMAAARRVPAMLNYSSGVTALGRACAAAAVRTVVTSRAFIEAARLGDAVQALSRTVRVVYLEDLRADFSWRDKAWLLARGYWQSRPFGHLAAPTETAVVLFTSGSEGRPKGVALSHAGMLMNMAQLRAVIDFGPGDRFLNALPMYHSYGLTACTLMPLLYGTPVFLYTNPLHYRVIPAIVSSRDCTYLFGTGTFLGHYATYAVAQDFASLRVVVSGGEKLNPEVARVWAERFGLRIHEGYGTTECGPAIALNTPADFRPETVGRALPCAEVRLLPVEGISGGGELHVRSPNMMLGYLPHDGSGPPEFPASTLGGGWYATGDVAELDEDGRLRIRGRLRRFAKVAGEMVSLETVERLAACASPGFRHAATIEADIARGESTVLFTTDPSLDRMRLARAVAETGLPEIAIARRLVHVAELPLLGTGKTDYVRLRTLAEASRAEPRAGR